MAEYFDLVLFGIFLGGITGGIGIPFIIHRNKEKNTGKRKDLNILYFCNQKLMLKS